VVGDCPAVAGVESVAVAVSDGFVGKHEAKYFPLVKFKFGCGFLCCFEEHHGIVTHRFSEVNLDVVLNVFTRHRRKILVIVP